MSIPSEITRITDEVATQTTQINALIQQANNLPDAGGSGETWELIKAITLDDAVNVITINQDADGRAFALKRVMIDCVIQLNAADPFTFIKTKINGFTVAGNATPQTASNNPRYYSFYAELIPDSGVLCWQACSGNNYNWHSELEKMGYKYNNIWSANAITSIELMANDGTKNVGIAGTKVHVMGVRA